MTGETMTKGERAELQQLLKNRERAQITSATALG
jgi:hypothetical protein